MRSVVDGWIDGMKADPTSCCVYRSVCIIVWKKMHSCGINDWKRCIGFETFCTAAGHCDREQMHTRM